MRRVFFSACLVSAFALSGCEANTGTTSATGGGTGSIAIDSLQSSLLSTMCSAVGKCSTWSTHYATPTGCVDIAGGEMDTSEQIADVKAGKLKYDGASAAQCLAVMGSMCLQQMDNEPAACTATFSGVIEDGKPCSDDKYCISRYCKTEPGKDCGVCAQTAKLGEKCEDYGNSCGKGNHCLDNVCVANGTVAAGAKCNSDDNCIAGHRCEFSADPVCKPLGAKDAACQTNSECASGTVCVFATFNGNEGKCGAAIAGNQPCFKIGSYSKEQCANGFTCAVPASWDGKSIPEAKCLAMVKLGAVCTSHMQCGMDATCKSGVCATLPAAAGDACAPPMVAGSDGRCGASLRCGTDDKCAAKSKVGEACKGNSDCTKGLDCSNEDKCFVPGKPGEACDSSKGIWCDNGAECGADNKCVAKAECK
jgi:hypothetical protein